MLKIFSLLLLFLMPAGDDSSAASVLEPVSIPELKTSFTVTGCEM